MNKIEKFKNLIRFVVSIFASREFGFIYCIIGTLAQCAHTYYLIESVSSLEGFAKQFQAWGLSIFISSSLLFFTAIAEGKNEFGSYDNESDKRIHLAVNLFMWIEIIINLYYYAAHLLLTNGIFIETNAQWFNFIFAILISCMIPVTIKLYAGIIQAKEWLEMLSKQDEQKQEIDENIIEQMVNQKLKEKEQKEIDENNKFFEELKKAEEENLNKKELEKLADKSKDLFEKTDNLIKQNQENKEEQSEQNDSLFNFQEI